MMKGGGLGHPLAATGGRPAGGHRLYRRGKRQKEQKRNSKLNRSKRRKRKGISFVPPGLYLFNRTCYPALKRWAIFVDSQNDGPRATASGLRCCSRSNAPRSLIWASALVFRACKKA